MQPNLGRPRPLHHADHANPAVSIDCGCNRCVLAETSAVTQTFLNAPAGTAVAQPLYRTGQLNALLWDHGLLGNLDARLLVQQALCWGGGLQSCAAP